MSTDLVATWRMSLSYVCAGVAHKLQFYVKGVTLVGSDWTLICKDASTLTFALAAENMVRTLAAASGADWTLGNVILQQKVGVQWVNVATHTPTTTPSGATTKHGCQVTITLVDTAHHPVKIVALDVIEPGIPFHFITPTGGDTAMDNLVAWFLSSPIGGDVTPFQYMVSRGNRYLNDFPFVSLSGTVNRKCRKAHGL